MRLQLAFTVALSTACSSVPDGVWTGECTVTRDDDTEVTLPIAMQFQPPEVEDATAGPLFGGEGDLHTLNLVAVQIIPPADEMNDTGVFKNFPQRVMRICASASCRLSDTIEGSFPYDEFNGSEGVKGDLWLAAYGNVAQPTGLVPPLLSVYHDVALDGSVAGEAMSGDIVWQSNLSTNTGDIVRVGRGPCSLSRLPQGFFDEYNEL